MDLHPITGVSRRKGKTMRASSGFNVRYLICLTGLLAFASTPLLAQTGIDLLDPEQVLRAAESDGVATVRATLAEVPGGVIQGSHERQTLQFDDGDFENFADDVSPLAPNVASVRSGTVEWAQRFELSADSLLVSARVCFYRRESDNSRDTDFKLRFYRNSVSNKEDYPGRRSGLVYAIEANNRAAGRHVCHLLRGDLTGKPLDRGKLWVAVEWDPTNMKRLGGDHYTRDDPADTDRNNRPVHETEVRERRLPLPDPDALNDGWTDGRSAGTTITSGLKAIGIRLEVETAHATPPPDPDPDPDPDPPPPEDDVRPGPLTAPPTGAGYTNCLPQVSRMVFDGDYRVSLCYETSNGTRGEARAGIYKSTQSGLLWFFDSNNAEVLVKVLDGCRQNNHRWVYMAAATDVAFNLYVTDGKSKTWSYHNKLGEAATTQTDTRALSCSP